MSSLIRSFLQYFLLIGFDLFDYFNLILFKVKYRVFNKHNKTYVARNSDRSLFPIRKVFVGSHTYGPINAHFFGGQNEYLIIGNFCSISNDVMFLMGGNHCFNTLSTYPFLYFLYDQHQSFSKGPIIVKDDVWIGSNSLILSGLTLGQGCIVAAGSVVTKSVPPYAIVGGAPASIIKYRFSLPIINQLIDFDYRSLHYDPKILNYYHNFFSLGITIENIAELKNIQARHYSNPRVTIGLAVHNSCEFLEDTIKSLIAQTEKRFILFISDDASTDSTEFICRHWVNLDPRIVYHRHNDNVGPRANFEFALSQSSTEFFMLASHDDLWSANFLEACIRELDENQNYNFVITKWKMISRSIPFAYKFFNVNFDFVTNPDPIKRMLIFTGLPFSTFKDNLTYGLWRTPFLFKVFLDTKATKYFSIGGASNEYALLNSPCGFVKSAFFIKRYKYFPPGTFFDKVLMVFLSFFRIKRSNRNINLDNILLSDIELVLKRFGLENNIIEKAIRLNLIHLKGKE